MLPRSLAASAPQMIVRLHLSSPEGGCNVVSAKIPASAMTDAYVTRDGSAKRGPGAVDHWRRRRHRLSVDGCKGLAGHQVRCGYGFRYACYRRYAAAQEPPAHSSRERVAKVSSNALRMAGQCRGSSREGNPLRPSQKAAPQNFFGSSAPTAMCFFTSRVAVSYQGMGAVERLTHAGPAHWPMLSRL